MVPVGLQNERLDSPLVEAARRWVCAVYTYNGNHLLRSLAWLDVIAPDASEAVRIATVTHDMERAFPGPDQPVSDRLNNQAYYVAHSERSARIVSDWLREQGAQAGLVAEVGTLIAAHETGGWPDADLVQAADSLSFLETNIDLFLGFARSGRYPLQDVGTKFERSYERIRVPDARELARPLLEAARARLTALEHELSVPSVQTAPRPSAG